MIEVVENIRHDAIRITEAINRLKTQAIDLCQILDIQEDIKECGRKMEGHDHAMLARYFTFLETSCRPYFEDFMKRIVIVRESINWLMNQPTSCYCMRETVPEPEPYCILGISLEPPLSGAFYEADRICLGE